jgi:hypothetical protein
MTSVIDIFVVFQEKGLLHIPRPAQLNDQNLFRAPIKGYGNKYTDILVIVKERKSACKTDRMLPIS